jgi:hypothetical protein
MTANCNGVVNTYSYPNPVIGNSMTVYCLLCEHALVKINLFNASGQKVLTLYPLAGADGANTYPVDLTGFSHGIYYYLVETMGGSGSHRSKPYKFAVIRSP